MQCNATMTNIGEILDIKTTISKYGVDSPLPVLWDCYTNNFVKIDNNLVKKLHIS